MGEWVLPAATLLMATTAPVIAQSGATIQATPPAMAVERLNQNLTRLSRQPTDMEALIGAGTASYELGDAQAANGFFTRANMVNPRNGRVKLGLALVSVALKQPRDAALYFDEAMALGETAEGHLPERALIYDLTGQQDKAQRDYVVALQARPGDAELIRSYAVSLGISGRVDLAEAQLRPLLFKSDRGAWRDRTMILAMNGRTAEARKIAQTIMPRSLADAMEPYLLRMGSLNPAQKAAATHYGQFPADGLRLATVTSPTAAPSPARADTTSRRVSARDRRKAASASAAPGAGGEDNSLLAAMPRGDAPPAMVQPIPSSSFATNPAPADPARTGMNDDDPDADVPAGRGPVRVATATPSTRRAAGRTGGYAVPTPSASTPSSPAYRSSRSNAPTGVRTAGVATAPDAVPAASSPVSSSPAPLAAPARMAQAPASTIGPVQGPGIDDASRTRAYAAAAQPAIPQPASPPPAAFAPPSNPPATVQPVPVQSGAAQPWSAPTSTISPAGPVAAPRAPDAAFQPTPAPAIPVEATEAPQPGFSTAPVAGPVVKVPPRTLAAIMAEIQVSEDAARAAAAPAVDLAEVARMQAARRKSAADKAKREATAKAKLEADAKLKAEAEEKARLKANPARIWVQIATGKDPAALAFDMRRLRKTYAVLATEDSFTAEWGATRRLLVGPYVSVTKAKAVLTDLKKAGSDGFVWQSEAGETVTSLSRK
ncbi:MAG: SPOR domain-containing protein [Sphingobium sp.]